MAVHPNSLENVGKGRKKGAKNKLTTDLKAAYLAAFEKRGGVQGLLDWAEQSPDAFYGQVSKMLPKEIDAKIEIENAPSLVMVFGKEGKEWLQKKTK